MGKEGWRREIIVNLGGKKRKKRKKEKKKKRKNKNIKRKKEKKRQAGETNQKSAEQGYSSHSKKKIYSTVGGLDIK